MYVEEKRDREDTTSDVKHRRLVWRWPRLCFAPLCQTQLYSNLHLHNNTFLYKYTPVTALIYIYTTIHFCYTLQSLLRHGVQQLYITVLDQNGDRWWRPRPNRGLGRRQAYGCTMLYCNMNQTPMHQVQDAPSLTATRTKHQTHYPMQAPCTIHQCTRSKMHHA